HMNTSRRTYVLRSAAAVAATALVWSVVLRGHGPYWMDLETVQRIEPAYYEAYGRGQLGVVRQHFARRYLFQAYRVLGGGTPVPGTSLRGWELAQWTTDTAPVVAWAEKRAQALGGTSTPLEQGRLDAARYRFIDATQQFLNCQDDAFASAVKTFDARSERFG